jgi:hypothetical protein
MPGGARERRLVSSVGGSMSVIVEGRERTSDVPFASLDVCPPQRAFTGAYATSRPIVPFSGWKRLSHVGRTSARWPGDQHHEPAAR